jgi:hypothetical protein
MFFVCVCLYVIIWENLQFRKTEQKNSDLRKNIGNSIHMQYIMYSAQENWSQILTRCAVHIYYTLPNFFQFP